MTDEPVVRRRQSRSDRPPGERLIAVELGQDFLEKRFDDHIRVSEVAHRDSINLMGTISNRTDQHHAETLALIRSQDTNTDKRILALNARADVQDTRWRRVLVIGGAILSVATFVANVFGPIIAANVFGLHP